MIEQPKHTPHCCGQTAKWVNPTLNLAYFYCEKCKKEVVESTTEGIGWKPTDYELSLQQDIKDAMRYAKVNIPMPPSPWGASIPLPTTLPPGFIRALQVGDKVSFEYNDGTQILRTFGCIESLGFTCAVREVNTGQVFYRLESELTLVP